jgi:hypothetical protein
MPLSVRSTFASTTASPWSDFFPETEQGQQRREPARVVADPAAGQQLAVPVHDGDVVVIFGPVDPAVNVHAFLLV